MTDANINSLLKWSVENSEASKSPNTSSSQSQNPQVQPERGPNPAALAALFGGPSDADLMRQSLAIVQDPSTSLEDRLTALDNFEQLIESIDNANNIRSLGLWTPLLSLLSNSEPSVRKMAAWCVGTAVQNNASAQERLVVMDGVSKLAEMVSKEGEEEAVRRKVVYALSSAVRNYQPATDEMVSVLPKEIVGDGEVRADDMQRIDGIMERLRNRA